MQIVTIEKFRIIHMCFQAFVGCNGVVNKIIVLNFFSFLHILYTVVEVFPLQSHTVHIQGVISFSFSPLLQNQDVKRMVIIIIRKIIISKSPYGFWSFVLTVNMKILPFVLISQTIKKIGFQTLQYQMSFVKFLQDSNHQKIASNVCFCLFQSFSTANCSAHLRVTTKIGNLRIYSEIVNKLLGYSCPFT